MFVKGIEEVTHFTRALHTISRNIDSTEIDPGAATLFFINPDGWALTCRHVLQHILESDQILQRKANYLKELTLIKGAKNVRQLKRELLKKYDYINRPVYEVHNMFMNCIEGNLEFDYFNHLEIDISLIHFKNYSKIVCDKFPLFAKDGSFLKQGKYLCRLGFPFPEFTNFQYDSTTDTIVWTQTARTDSPIFPIEGMVTRHLLDSKKTVFGFEMSTPGLKGQSGGPAFDQDGIIWGMQSATNHLDLNFDIKQEVKRGGKKVNVQDHAFLHVGHCIHVDALKSFMKLNGVSFAEG